MSSFIKVFSRTFIIAFCLTGWATVAMAENVPSGNSDMKTDEQIWQSVGVTDTFSDNQLNVVINEQQALDSIPGLQALGAMNSDITQTEINTTPVTLSSSVGLFAITGMLPDLYRDNPSLNNLQVKIYLDYVDDYGNTSKKLIFTFNFSRDLYNKINWNNFSRGDLMKVAPNFEMTQWCKNQAENELGS